MINKKIGIVIGNNYPKSDNELKFSVADAEKIKEILENKDICGFDEVKYLPDKTSREALLVIEKTLRYADNDLVFIYYSGHGTKDHEGKLCLLFDDTEKDCLVATSVTFDFINKCVKYPSRKSVVMVLDCCYSCAAEIRDWDTDVTEDLNNLSGSGTVILTSTGLTGSSKAREDEKLGHGIFTYYLIEGLEKGSAANADGLISIDDLYAYASKKTTEKTSEKNCTQFPKMIGEKEGTIYIGKNPLKVREREFEFKRDRLLDEFGAQLPSEILGECQAILRKHYKNPSLMDKGDIIIFGHIEALLKSDLSPEKREDIILNCIEAVQHLKKMSINKDIAKPSTDNPSENIILNNKAGNPVIRKGQSKMHQVNVNSEVKYLTIGLKWGNKNNSLSLTIYSPSGDKLGPIHDNSEEKDYGGISSNISPKDEYIESGTWIFKVYGESVSGTESYTLNAYQHRL